MTRNTGWGSDSSTRPASRSSGWSQDDLHKPKQTAPSLQEMQEDLFIQKHYSTLVEIFGDDFKNDPRYAKALAKVLEGKRAVHMILADYRPREQAERGGAGW